ncbi:MAG: hypothetical protein AWM53_00237 [Candidatus Dichloromethanomonas elyunquensis]|nr:MAG: hypothetical protein AWM53_00237 [Candidatus Dichloromethanomonas elyunquensis]
MYGYSGCCCRPMVTPVVTPGPAYNTVGAAIIAIAILILIALAVIF